MPDQPALIRVAQPPETDGVPLPQRYWAILTIALGLTLAVLDGAIANVALPTIARDVNASPSASIWVVNAYQLAVTISLLPLASLGEIYGYRRVYQWGLVVFTIASLFCSLSDLADDPDHGPHRPGLRRRGDHERQRRPGPLHLSAPLAGPRRRAECHGRLGGLGAGPHRGGGDPVGAPAGPGCSR